VNRDGTVNASSGLANPSANVRVDFGTYRLTFNRDVSSCAWNVSRVTDLGVLQFDPNVQLTAFGSGMFGIGGNGTVEVIGIGNGGSATDHPFSLVVVCP
jgi:hypothetical protein